MSSETLLIPCITSDGVNASYFTDKTVELTGDESRRLSAQMAAVNFRLRSSDQHYGSDFHVAGDPTLLIVLSGTIKLTLRSGESRSFTTGDLFIAEDYLQEGVSHQDEVHGHKADVVGGQALKVLHLKLSKR